MAKLNIMESARTLFSLLTRSGMLFGGARNLYSVYGYRPLITFLDTYAKYRRQDIANRIVNAPADAVWDKPPIISCGLFQDQFEDLVSRLNLWQVFNRCDKLSAMGRYSTVLVGIDDGKSLDQPVTPNENHKILYMQPYSFDSLRLQQLDGDVNSSHFNKPLWYSLKPLSPADERGQHLLAPLIHTKVHYTRVIHICDGVLEDDVYGIPRLEVVYNLLDDMIKVSGGSAEIYWLNARSGMQVDVDKDAQFDADDAADLTSELEEYVQNLRRTIRTRGVKVNMLESKVSDPGHTFDILVQLLSAATGIPQRVLLGAEAGQLASEQDRANWATFINQRRAHFAEPGVIKPFFVKMAEIGLVQPKSLPTIGVTWPEAFDLSPLERAMTSAQVARSAANLSKTIVQTPKLVSMDEARRVIVLGLPNESFENTASKQPDTVGTEPSQTEIIEPLDTSTDVTGDNQPSNVTE